MTIPKTFILLFPLSIFVGCHTTTPGDGDHGSADFIGDGEPVIEPESLDLDIETAAPNEITFDGQSYRKISSISRIDYGEVVLDVESGISSYLVFDVPEDGVSLSIVITPLHPIDYAYVYDLIDPNGTFLITPQPAGVSPEEIERAGRGQVLSPNGVHPAPMREISVTPVPSVPDVQVSPGRWGFRVASEMSFETDGEPVRAQVTLMMKHHSEEASDSAVVVLPMNMRFAPGNVLGSASMFEAMEEATGMSLLATNLSSLTGFLGEIGIVPMVSSMTDIDEGYNEQLQLDATTGLSNEPFTEMMTEFPRRPGEMSLFFVEYTNLINYQGVGTFDGLSSSMIEGAFSGVIISARLRDGLEKTLAHEIGHHLGLYHTNVDLLDDTFYFDHFLEGDQLAARDLPYTGNLMDVSPAGFSVTGDQVEIMRLRPGLATYNPVL